MSGEKRKQRPLDEIPLVERGSRTQHGLGPAALKAMARLLVELDAQIETNAATAPDAATQGIDDVRPTDSSRFG